MPAPLRRSLTPTSVLSGIILLLFGFIPPSASAQVSFTVLHNFTEAEVGQTTGASPLVQGSDGNLYGVAYSGPGTGACSYNGITLGGGCGSIFRITPAGTLTTVHAFVGTDGALPVSLVMGSDGNLYGVTEEGGPPCSGGGGSYGCGTFFKATLSGAVTTLHAFSAGAWQPILLIAGGTHLFYGITGVGFSQIFKMTYGGAFSTVYAFDQPGEETNATGLVLGHDGNLYGAYYNYNENEGPQASEIFMLTPSGTITVLGSYPTQGPTPPLISFLLASDGNVYGANSGGIDSGEPPIALGNIFQIPPGGPLTNIYSFTGQADGEGPTTLLQAFDGNLYGIDYTTGTVASLFQVTTGGVLTALSPAQLVSGTPLFYDMMQGMDGNLYGTTNSGGTSNLGVVYQFTLGPEQLSLIDPVPTLVNGLGVVTNPTSLATATTTVAGVAADGAAEVVVRVKAPSAGISIQLSLADENGNPATSSDGPNLGYLTTLLSTDGSGSTEDGSPITVTTVALSDGTGMAFAVYHAPSDFVRTQNASDPQLSSRQESVVAQVGDATTTLTFQVVRPPVAFVHGIWGHPTDGDQITYDLQTAGVGIVASEIGYDEPVQITSSSPSYGTNYTASGDTFGFQHAANELVGKLNKVVALYRTNNSLGQPIAVVSADVVAHSMGGDAVRTMPLVPGYSSPLSYGAGLVHKLITVGTPHLGSPLATQLAQSTSACTRSILKLKGLYAFTSVKTTVGTFTGGIGDLEGDLAGDATSLSKALGAIQVGTTTLKVTIPTGIIVGSMTPAQLDTVDTSTDAKIIRFICSKDPLAQDLTSANWPTLVGAGSDAIVPLNSELAGSSNNSIVSTLQAVHSPGTESLGFADGNPPGPSELDGSSGVPGEVLQLLNTPVSNAAFVQLP